MDLKLQLKPTNKIVNFLDVTVNLSNGTDIPYTKPNSIHKKSNHPPQIIKNIPKSINKRLSEISYDQDSFDKAVPLYQKALNDSVYKHRLAFLPPTASEPRNSDRNYRHRDIIWYNPQFSKSVATNVGRTFLKILDEEFPKGRVLHKIFNRNTLKISYSCMTNLKQNIDGHNKSTLHKKIVPSKTCNCKKPADCTWLGIVSRNPWYTWKRLWQR